MDSLLHFSDYTDPNNNTSNSATATVLVPLKDKYSLRPRSIRRRLTDDQADVDDENKTTSPTITSKRQYRSSKINNLSSSKQKPAPLSKYRRKTANARERNRMREINQAFETLRQVIPNILHQNTSATNNEKLTKITTLRLAMKYITSLSAALSDCSSSSSSSSSSSTSSSLSSSVSVCSITDELNFSSNLDCLLLESDGESLPLSDHSSIPDFPEPSLSPVDFSDPSLPALLQTDFTEHTLDPGDFGEFLLT